MWSSIALLTLLAVGPAAEATGSLAIRIIAPARVSVGGAFRVTFVASNNGTETLYFKRPWKWASNALYLRASDRAGRAVESNVVLSDISSEAVCSYIKPLLPGESLSFEEELGTDPDLPGLLSKVPGHYFVKWLYQPAIWESDDSCVPPGGAVWRGHVESQEVAVKVDQVHSTPNPALERKRPKRRAA